MSQYHAPTRWTAFLLCACAPLCGCTWNQLNPFKPPVPLPPPVQSFVLRNGALVADNPPVEKSMEAQLAGAQEYFRRGDYAHAERLFHYVANKEKNTPALVQEALYYEGECLRLQGDLPKAADTYSNLVKNHISNTYREQALQRMFDIANYWLQDTWEEMREAEEKKQGKRWIVWPRFICFDKRKPFLDRQGRAVERLQDVYTYEGKGGALSDKAFFLCGHVHRYNEEWRDADHCFTQLHLLYPDSPFAADAVQLAIAAKLASTGGELYDGRKVAEARKMVGDAMRMPQLDEQRKASLHGLLKSISAQQAEKDLQMAEFYRRTGHPGSAYFMYEVVRRRYPNPHADSAASRATRRMFEIRAKMEKEERDKLGPPPEGQGDRPTEMLPPPRRVATPPEAMPMPRPSGELAPMPRKANDNSEQAPPPRPLPQGQ